MLLGVLPAGIVAIVLAVYFTTTRLNDMYELVDKTNQNLASSLAESSVNSVFSGNIDALDTLLQGVINEPDIISIEITDSAGIILSSIQKKDANVPLSKKTPTRITQAIKVSSLLSIDEFENLLVGPIKETDNIIGYVNISLSYASIKQRQRKILLNSIYITALLLLAIAVLTNIMSKTIGQPILNLANDVKRMTKGDFSLPIIRYDSNDEISTLTFGIHEMASEIENHQNTLQHKIDEATQELRFQNERLSAAQRQIVKAIDAKTRFVSHISHEIRTPLNGIIGFLEILQSSQLDLTQQKLIRASLISSKNLHLIINEVLDLAQLEAGKVKVQKSNFHLRKTIEDALSILQLQAENRGVILEYRHDDKAPDFINQDPVKFGQVLINLVNNAIKFSHDATVTVSIKVHQPKPNHIEVCVTDQGIGISEQNIAKLFKEFTQLDTNSAGQGSGLGLVITKLILNALHGSINVKSQLGKGSVFCFNIPFTTVDESYDELINPNSIEPILPNLSYVTVLVADDNEINRLLLTHLLEQQNATVVCATNGQEALDLASKQTFNLMLLDLRMPFKMGNEALHEIRMQPHNPNYKTPAIAITAHLTSGIERAHHISSFDGYLVKPIDQIEFFKLIDQLLHEHDYETNPYYETNNESSAAHDTKVFDYHAAQKSMKADDDFMLFILDKFFQELPEQQKSIRHHISTIAYEKAAEIVHKVQGSAAYCGTFSLKIAAKQLESDLRNNNATAIKVSADIFYTAAKALLKSKQPILQSLKKPL